MHNNKYQKAAIVALGMTPFFAFGASFQLLEQSPAQLSKAFAGTASDAGDATTVFFNPAAMGELERTSVTGGLNLVRTEADFSNEGSTYPGPEDSTEELGVIPNLYLAMPMSERFSFGFGIGAPYGLSSSFSNNWVGRYSATESELELINFNITGSWSLTDTLAVGLGVNYQRMDVTLENQVDSTLGVAPDPSTDSAAEIEGDDDDIVLDASVYYKPVRGTRLGLTWRQGGDFTLDGDADFHLNAACAPGAGFPTGAPPAPTTGTLCAGALNARQGNIEAEVELPDTITLSLSQQLGDTWTLHADVAQTRWSSIGNVNVVNTTSGVTVDTLDLQYDDTMRYALGTTVNTGGAWTWRAGIAHDEAPQTDPEHATARIPDEDRTWVAVGANWIISNDMSLDLSYAHLFVDDATVVDLDATSGRRLSGSFDSRVDILGAQVNWQF